MPKDKVNILIVDDKSSNIFAMEALLSRPERRFFHATDGKEALKLVINEEICLIILDVKMPGMDGFEVAKIIKSSKRTKDIPIIFASAEKTEREFMVKGFEEGAIDYLQKPPDKELTEAKVSVLLRLYLQKKELQQKNLILEKYALLINNSADMIGIINAATLKFEEINKAVLPALGYHPDEIKNTSLLHYLLEDEHYLIKKQIREGMDNFTFEAQMYCKNRSIKWFHWNIVQKRGLWFANARDITAKKEVEEIKNYLAAVVKQSKDAIYLHNPDGHIISWNKGAEVNYGFTESEALNMKIWNIVPKFLMAETQEMITSILKGDQIRSVETKRINKYGKIIDVVLSASVITDANNVLKSIAITERDITQQKKAEEEIQQLNEDLQRNVNQLEATNQELESFSHSVSHDLRAPLRAIHGYTNIIREEFDGQMNEELNRLFQIIQHNSKRMGILIDGLLDFSKLGRKEVKKCKLHTRDMVVQIFKEMAPQLKPSVKFTIHELPDVQGDYTLIYQCLVNLISNAIKYSSKKDAPKIEVGFEENDIEYIYYISDNGAGFDMKYAHKLFGVFQRLHRDDEFEGTGVGLGIVQRIIAKHGGRVLAKGQFDKGATFYFTLPKQQSEWMMKQ
ncbi:PAS domain S-box protein [Litoribacter populi]|uniref:PAS domain S-box protein n=1 Tax=Litoribacter populi TaxID=2598460 RepID=UPI00118029DE|nr:PAS domain S-box protein [Litoribacter populi]